MKYLKKQFVHFNNKLKLKYIVCDVYKYCSDKQNVNIFKNKSNNKTVFSMIYDEFKIIVKTIRKQEKAKDRIYSIRY